jgi:hypothetical protein
MSISPKIPSSPLKASSFIISSPTTFFLGVAHMNTLLGLHITSILEHFEINLSGEKETRKVIPTDVYGVTTMRQMKYSLKDMVKRDAIVEEELDEEAQMEEDGA